MPRGRSHEWSWPGSLSLKNSDRRLRESAFVVLFGTVRLAWAPESSRDVRVIALNPPDLFKILSQDQLMIFQRYFMKLEVDPTEVAPILEEIRRANRGLLALGAQAVASGVDYLVWPEGGLIAFGDAEETELVGVARGLAQDGGFHLGIGIGVLRPGPEELHENKILWIDPNGETVGEYHKTQLVPYVETSVTRPGSGRVLVSDTAPARIGTVICYDMDNPRFLAEAGREGVEILFAPSSDWDAIATIHHRMAVFRAVEQGFQLVRPANHGILAAVDSRGRVLASLRHDDPAGGVLTATIPVSRSRTIYSRIGDGLPWLCLGLLLILAITAAIRSR